MRLIAALLLIPIGGCFAEPDPGGEDDDAATSTNGTDSEGTATSAGPASGSGSQSGASASLTSTEPSTGTSDPSVTSDTSGPMDTGSPECGALGQSCCPGEACDEGACWNDRCVVFAGMYAEPYTCSGCTEEMIDGIPPSFIPYLGMCGCPIGFDTSEEVPTTSDYCPADGLLHTNTNLRFCQLSDPLPENADWQGVYVTSSDPMCQTSGDDCVLRNPYTRDCSCLAGSVEVLVETFTKCLEADLSPDHSVHIHVCVDPDVEPISFGGAYQTRWIADSPPACEVGNPLRNDECECPEGFLPEALRITSPISDQGGDLFVCVRY